MALFAGSVGRDYSDKSGVANVMTNVVTVCAGNVIRSKLFNAVFKTINSPFAMLLAQYQITNRSDNTRRELLVATASAHQISYHGQHATCSGQSVQAGAGAA